MKINDISIGEEIMSIRMHLWRLTDDIVVTERQRDELIIIKDRLFRLAEKLMAEEK